MGQRIQAWHDAKVIPVIDISCVANGGPPNDRAEVGNAIDAACRSVGFFAITGHGLDVERIKALEAAAHSFFAQTSDSKAQIAMAKGGRAWRGWFPFEGELTSGRPDQKEGIYFGSELSAEDPRVEAGLALHGPNQFPAEPAALKQLVLEWLDEMTTIATTVMRCIALGLGLDEHWFERELTADPTILFRIFRYPPTPAESWGVQTHTDYGLLTLLVQDEHEGLEVRAPSGWIQVPGGREKIICNLGDMLDRMTGGRYRSTPHRVRNTTNHDRLSFPFFFDPSWNARVAPIPIAGAARDDDQATRWDGTSLRQLSGTYGEYLLAKVTKVFPDLGNDVLS